MLAVAFVLLAFVGYHFAVRTLRIVSAVFAATVIVAVTLYGVSHQAKAHQAKAHASLADFFTSGFNHVSNALLRPLVQAPHQVPAPGQTGWLVIIAVLVFAYRQLEAWAMRWGPRSIDVSALDSDKQEAQQGEAHSGMTDEQRRSLFAELRFRLPAVAVRAPAILPGGTKQNELASIAENSGVKGSGLAGAIIRFFGMLWPSPRRYRVRIWIERDEHSDSGGQSGASIMRITVGLEDPRAGGNVATKTLVANGSGEAASVVAGYVARHVFAKDPTAPPWCVGSFDGDDLAAMLIAGQQRIIPGAPDDVRLSRNTQISVFEKCKLTAGVARYELAQLYDLAGYRTKALRLHALNRRDYPRFYRGRYRLGMSLEMIANPTFDLSDKEAAARTHESLSILDRCRVTTCAAGMYEEIVPGVLPCGQVKRRLDEQEGGLPAGVKKALPDILKKELLTAAQREMRKIRRELTLWRVIRAMLLHRDERAIRKPYWRLRGRQSFHDGALVAELLLTVRQRLNEEKILGIPAGEDFRQFLEKKREELSPTEKAIRDRLTEIRYHSAGTIGYHTRRALHIAAAITRDNEIRQFLKEEPTPQCTKETTTIRSILTEMGRRWPTDKISHHMRRALHTAAAITADIAPPIKALRERASKLSEDKRIPNVTAGSARWLPWQHRTPSWQAAYNMACLYQALEQRGTVSDEEEGQEKENTASGQKKEQPKESMAWLAVESLRNAVYDRDCEMERPYDWISNDPDFRCLTSSEESGFLARQRELDYPAESKTCLFCRMPDADIMITPELMFPVWVREGPAPAAMLISCQHNNGLITKWTANEPAGHILRAVCPPVQYQLDGRTGR